MSLPHALLPLSLAALLLTGCPSPSADHATATTGQVQAIGSLHRATRSVLPDDSPVLVEGVVTAGSIELGGWFVQDAGDGDPATSDALFVPAGDATPPLTPGTRVRVTGHLHTAHDGSGPAPLLQLQPSRVDTLGRGAVDPVALTAAPEDWAPYAGMHVRIDAPLTLIGHHDLARRGVLVTSFQGRQSTPTDIALPGAPAAAVAATNTAQRLLLDDASSLEDPPTLWYLPAATPAPRSGSQLTGAEGVLDHRFGQYRLQLTAPLQVQADARPAAPQVPGDLRVVVFNLENLFNGDGRGGGFPTPRGARTPAELDGQLARLAATVNALAPDILAVMELENDGYGPRAAISALTAALGPDWRHVDSGHGPGDDAIRVGLLYRASRVRLQGRAATLQGGPFGTGSRVPLAQAFVPVADGRDDGAAFTVVANHFKSKGCRDATGANRDQGDGQACWNAMRTDSARRLLRWLDTDPTGTGAARTAIVGDFNAYTMEDPLRLLREAGWQDALAGQATPPYTYVFDGQAGRLDHALLGQDLAARLRGAAIWHANADEPAQVGYRGDAGQPPAAPGPWRSSDHDPIVLGLDLRTH